MSDALMYTPGTRIPCLLGVRNSFANKRLLRPRIVVKLASLAYLGFRII